jgi:hypothetical protein
VVSLLQEILEAISLMASFFAPANPGAPVRLLPRLEEEN